MPTRIMELCVPLTLRASHSLEEREAFHEHIWRIEAYFTGPIKNGRIASLPAITTELLSHLEVLQGTILNTNRALDAASRATPTCECLILYLEEKFALSLKKTEWQHLTMRKLKIAVDEVDGSQTGFAQLVLGN